MQAQHPVVDQARQGYNPGGGIQQPGFPNTQGQFDGGNQQPGYHPVENIKQTLQGNNHVSTTQDRSSYGNEQPVYSNTQGQYGGGSQQPGYHPVEGIKQAVHEHNPMSSDQPRHQSGMREDNVYGGRQPGYSSTQGQYADNSVQPSHHSTMHGYRDETIPLQQGMQGLNTDNQQPNYAVGQERDTVDNYQPSRASAVQTGDAIGSMHPDRHSTVRAGLADNINQNVHAYKAVGSEQPLQGSAATTTMQGRPDLDTKVHPSYSPMPIQHQSSLSVARPVLEGHVFGRMQLYAALPESLRDDTEHFRAYVEKDKSRLFSINKRSLIKSVYSVRGGDLIDFIVTWLNGRYAAHGRTRSSASSSSDQQGSQAPADAETITPASIGVQESIHSATESSSSVPVAAEILGCAKLVAEALVLSGFLTPYKEKIKHINTGSPQYHLQREMLYIPVAKTVMELRTASVWSVVDGAIYARALKHSSGKMSQLMGGKDVYLVINEKTNTAYMFASDLARVPIDEFRGDLTSVQFDNSHFTFGVSATKLGSGMEKEKPDIFDAGTRSRQQELLEMWLRIGAAQYHEHDMKKLIDVNAPSLAGATDLLRDDKKKRVNFKSARSGSNEEVVPASRTYGSVPAETSSKKVTPFGAHNQSLPRDEHSAPTAA